MNDASLKRLMRLARQTGDVLIITDPEGQEPIVLMSVDRYEVLRSDEIDRLDEEAAHEKWSEPPAMEWVDEPDDVPSEASDADLEEEFEERIGPLATEPEVTPLDHEELRAPDEVEKEAEKPQKLAENGEEKFYLEPIE